MCATQMLPMRVGPFAFRYQWNGATPSHYIDTTRKAIDCAITMPLSFYIMKLFSRLFVLYCRNCPKDDKFRYTVLHPHVEEVRGAVEPRLMARWKARVEFLLSVTELLLLSLTVEALQGKCVKTRCLQEGVGHLEPRFQGDRVVPLPTY